MTGITLYHNPRCSKSREALKLLQERKASITIVEYLKKPLSKHQLQELITLLDISPSELVRKKEALFKELNLAKATGSQLIEAMAKHPILMERPIVITKGKAIIGRPPENVLRLL